MSEVSDLISMDDAPRAPAPKSPPQALIDIGTHALRQTRYGYMIYLKGDVHVGRSIELYGEYSEGEIALFRQLITPGMTVVDGGANLGSHTLFFAKQVGPTGTVFAFEPQRMLHQILCGNMALNGIDNVHCLHAGLGAKVSEGIMPVLDIRKFHNTGAFTFNSALQGERVPILPLDQFNLPELHFVKLDVEGMELDAIKGMQFTIRYRRPVLYVENSTDRPTYEPEQSHALVNALLDMNYQIYWHWPPVFNADNFYDNQKNIFASQIENVTYLITSSNMICIPAEKRIEVPDALPAIRDDDPVKARTRLMAKARG